MKRLKFMLSMAFGAMSILSLGSLIASISVISSTNASIGLLAWLIVSSVAFAGFFAAGAVFFYLDRIKKGTTSIYSNFFGDVYTLVPEGLLVQMAERLPSKKETTIVSFSIRGFGENVISLYGLTFARNVNSLIAKSLKDRFEAREDILYCFDFNDTFSLVARGVSPSQFGNEALKFIQDLKENILSLGIILDLTIDAGSYSYSGGDKETMLEGFRRAHIAKKWALSNNIDGQIVSFDLHMINESRDELDFVSEFTRSLENEDFEVYYQPKYDLRLQRFVGAEALIRWNHPTKGLVFPDAFIPTLEKDGKIVELDKYVLVHVCKDLARWRLKKQRLVQISVNLSRYTAHMVDVTEFIKSTIDEYGVNPMLLEFELTESIASQDTLFALHVIKKIKSLGVKVAMDDFGVGYSSLSILKQIPFDTIKIDKSFFDDVEVEQKARDIIKALSDLGDSLKMYMVAEGIQTAKQISILKSVNINCVQGFFYSKAMPCFAFETFLANNKFEKKGEANQ